jgi:ABC-type glycerol-3-phosphate transport system substrate-binding protein
MERLDAGPASSTRAPGALDFEAAGFSSIEEVYAAYESGEALLAGARFGDTLYGLPTELSIYACYANDDMFQAAGLDPTTDFPNTWEEMVDVAEKMTVREDNVPTTGTISTGTVPSSCLTMLRWLNSSA